MDGYASEVDPKKVTAEQNRLHREGLGPPDDDLAINLSEDENIRLAEELVGLYC